MPTAELDEVDAAESRRVLVLLAAGEVDALDFESDATTVRSFFNAPAVAYIYRRVS